jgi:hypothetical protein
MFFELSYTRRKALACPYSFQKLYATGETTASQLDASAGILGHDLIAEYIAHLDKRHRQRDTEWMVERFNAAMETQHPYIREFLEKPIANFMQWYTHNRASQHYLEQEFWATADGQPLPLLPPGTPLPCDCYHGRADWIEVEHGGLKAVVHDWKLGWNRTFLGTDCQRNEQLMGYCWLYLLHHPECQTVVGALHPLRFTTTPIYGSWRREHLLDIMPQIIAPDFATVRALYDQHGAHQWPAIPQYETCCRWCMLACPRYEGES